MNDRSMDLLHALGAVDESVIDKTAPLDFSDAAEETVTGEAPKIRRINRITAGLAALASAAACIAVFTVLIPRLNQENPHSGDSENPAVTTTATTAETTLPLEETTGTAAESTTTHTTAKPEVYDGMTLGVRYDVDSQTYYSWLYSVSTDVEVLNVPETYMGYPVTGAESDAFSGCTALKSVTLPDTMVHINKNMFADTPWYQNAKKENACLIAGSILLAVNQKTGVLRIPEGVTRINSWAFAPMSIEEVSAIEEIYFPESLKVIEDEACMDIETLKTVHFPEGLETIGRMAFTGCTSLTAAHLPKGLKKLGVCAFSHPDVEEKACISLKEVTLPEQVSDATDEGYVDLNAFWGTPWREKHASMVIANHKLLYVGNVSGNVVIPDGVEEICERAFWNNKKITSLSVPGSVKVIPPEMCVGCSNLNHVELHEGLKEIGYNAFTDCDSLEEIIIPEGVEAIYSNAFSGYYDTEQGALHRGSLRSVTIPDSVTYFGAHVFALTPWLEEQIKKDPLMIVNGILLNGSACEGDVIIPEGVKRINAEAFSRYETEWADGEMPFSEDALGNQQIRSVTLPESIEEIGDRAFKYCKNLKTVHFPDKAIKIGMDAFNNTAFWDNACKQDECIVDSVLIAAKGVSGEYTVPERVRSIAPQAFANNTKVTKVTVPASVSDRLESLTFFGCDALEEIRLEGITEIVEDAIRGCSALKTIYFPDSLKTLDSNSISECSRLKQIYISLGTKLTSNGKPVEDRLFFDGADNYHEITRPNIYRRGTQTV